MIRRLADYLERDAFGAVETSTSESHRGEVPRARGPVADLRVCDGWLDRREQVLERSYLERLRNVVVESRPESLRLIFRQRIPRQRDQCRRASILCANALGDLVAVHDYVPLSIYDAGTGLITSSSTYEYFQLPSLDRTGEHYFSGGNLRDRTLRLIGGIPTYMGYMRPDGRRAYEVNSSNRTHLKVFDLTGSGPGFSQLADIVVAHPIDGYWLAASLDSRFMFIPGPSRFIVVPLP